MGISDSIRYKVLRLHSQKQRWKRSWRKDVDMETKERVNFNNNWELNSLNTKWCLPLHISPFTSNPFNHHSAQVFSLLLLDLESNFFPYSRALPTVWHDENVSKTMIISYMISKYCYLDWPILRFSNSWYTINNVYRQQEIVFNIQYGLYDSLDFQNQSLYSNPNNLEKVAIRPRSWDFCPRDTAYLW